MRFFKREQKAGLEKAEQLNLITEFEKLKLKKDRATEKLDKYLANKKKKKR